MASWYVMLGRSKLLLACNVLAIMISSVEGWLKGRLAEAGFSHIGVRRLDGNASQSQKERTMEAFKSG